MTKMYYVLRTSVPPYEVLPTVFAVIDLTVIKANRAKRCPKYTVLPSIITRASYYGSVERFPEDGIVV